MTMLHAAARTAFSVGVGYALGNLPSADVAARLAGAGRSDVRNAGSGNPGALNAGKNLGSRWGSAVLVADISKGVAAGMIGRTVAGPLGANLSSSAAVLGHCYPVGREGGKGVATSIGQVIATFPTYLPVDIAVAAATVALPRWTQRTWAATAVASATWVSAAFLAYKKGWPTGVEAKAPLALPVAALLSSTVIAKRFLDTPLVDGKPQDDQRVPDSDASKLDKGQST